MSKLKENRNVFTFGSNERGLHGAGAALHAYRKHGAVMGNGVGYHGNSYAIPTKDQFIETLPLEKVRAYIHNFICFAEIHPKLMFQVTRIGCGLAGFEDGQIAPLFRDAPENCSFDTKWEPWLGTKVKYWGTF